LPARWYDLDANKNDLTLYFKQQTKIGSLVSVFYDMQYRGLKYNLYGFRDNPGIIINNNYNFFNPKAGLSFQKSEWSGYLSYSLGQKEPNREDFEAGIDQQPKPEKLNDLELGIEQRNDKYNIGLTGYYMHYKDQLVLMVK
jgi:iron complex outermembrane receptor protein